MRQKTLNTIRSMIGDYMSSHIAREDHRPVDYPMCEACGCLLPLTAIAGEKEVRQRLVPNSYFQSYEDYIYTPRYCKKCAPQNEKEGPEKPYPIKEATNG